MLKVQTNPATRIRLIPNFCTLPVALSLALAMELVALCFTLTGQIRGGDVLQRLVLLSLYLQWIGLCGATLLCWMRRFLTIARPSLVFFVCWAALVVEVMLLSSLAWMIGTNPHWGVLDPNEPRLWFVFRHSAIAGVVAVLLLRYFWSRHQWREQVRAESESRYQALNARIRPHFLFNALNSLAALIGIRPDEAEGLVEDLADVFRASLEKPGQMAPFVDEISICNAYLRIEKARLGDRLQVDWDVDESLLAVPVPSLIVQPLVENAVHHGVSKRKDGGAIQVRGFRQDTSLVIEVANPLAPQDEPKEGRTAHSGNQVAVNNIASRLALIYGERGKLELGVEDSLYKARLHLPLKMS
jgi:two-component system sensor histidine kinase AlgZ